MKLDQLHCFQEACKYHSISVAAEKNYISQPSFSSAITKLEKELGVTLLNRTSRGVSPTPIGVVILEKVQGIFELVEDIQSVATAHSSYGTVQLATIPDLCDKILPISAQLAKAKNLNLQLTVHTAESDEIYHSVLSGVDSLGVVFFSTRVQSPELRFTPLFEDEYVLCVGPQSPYWDAESITIAEAMQQPSATACRTNPSRRAINDRRFQTKMNSSPAQVSCVGLLFFYALYSPLICSASRAPSRT